MTRLPDTDDQPIVRAPGYGFHTVIWKYASCRAGVRGAQQKPQDNTQTPPAMFQVEHT
jgi:hypothetical protein